MPSNIVPDHVPPPGPIVGPTLPQTQGIAYAFIPQDARQILGAFPVRIIAASDQNYVHAAQVVEPPTIVLVGQIFNRVVVVDIIVMIAVGPLADVVDAAHADGAAHQLG